jgi:hypothetical protein
MRLWLTASCVLFVFAGAAEAAEILHFPKPKAAVQPAGIPAGCREWTDACRVCALDDKGTAACSNVGIACLPQKWRCMRP